ncbi:MAG: alanine/glycine:cation symporter family protein [Planctomycetota bacterium]
MEKFWSVFWSVVKTVNDLIWHDVVLFIVLGVGVLFTVWSKFGQYRALVHGSRVVRGVYDDKRDPGAINHFQALSTALSATVGLGNIGGVAVAISVGGPGAVFWMWVVGLVGMCLKMTEVTQAMLFRDTTVPDQPRGGAMWVCRKGFAQFSPSLAKVGTFIGGLFCVTLIISAVTGGNMFQAWNVADLTQTSFAVDKWITGAVLTVLVGLVIVGGIKRIGDVAGRIVPAMCLIYVAAALLVVVMNVDQIPSMLALIVTEAFRPSEAAGAFLGGSAGFAFLKGMQRALFSNEAGQGSAPIAHSAAKTDEPVREGVVAGLEPFIDTLCVCTMTALVILLSGAWNRAPSLVFVGEAPTFVRGPANKDGTVPWSPTPFEVRLRADAESDSAGAAGGAGLADGTGVFLVAASAPASNSTTGGSHHKLEAMELKPIPDDGAGRYRVVLVEKKFTPLSLPEGMEPRLVSDGIYLDLKAASLTAYSFDQILPGFGKWVVTFVAWLFAFSTIISWSYYGEQGILYLLGSRFVVPYRVVYCLLILVTAQAIETDDQLDWLSTLGTGVMLWVNIPIMLTFGPIAMRAYHDYFARLEAGTMDPPHAAPRLRDVVEGDDVE